MIMSSIGTGPMKSIMIDPGHGGADPGAVSCLGYNEKDLNLSIAKQLANQLKQAGWRVSMTRSTDTDVSLNERVALANVEKPDIFFSIHADSWTTAGPRGSTVFIAPQASDTSQATAEALILAMPAENNRGIKRANYRVLAKTKCPAVLIEMGFLSNPQDAKQLQDEAFQQNLVKRITKALLHLK